MMYKMEQLPWDCVRLLAYKLPLSGLYRLGVTSKHMSKLFDDEVLWKYLFYRDRELTSVQINPPGLTRSWLDLYQNFYPLRLRLYPRYHDQGDYDQKGVYRLAKMFNKHQLETFIFNLVKNYNNFYIYNIEYHCSKLRMMGDIDYFNPYPDKKERNKYHRTITRALSKIIILREVRLTTVEGNRLECLIHTDRKDDVVALEEYIRTCQNCVSDDYYWSLAK